MMMEQVARAKISIVIPVYNGEKYLKKTLESILKQTFIFFEVIIVNDSSTDKSLLILKEYEEKDSRIRIFSTDSNLGIVPKVINFAIPFVRGDYFLYSSQDDLFSEDLLENLFNRAVITDADAVIPDLVFFHEHENEKNKSLIGVHGNRDVLISNREAVLLSLDWFIPGNALWKISLIRTIGFYDFGMNADEYSVRVFLFHCNKVAFCTGTFFYRQDNPDAITKKLSSKTFDIPYTEFMLYLFLRDNSFESKVQERILMRAITALIFMKTTLIKHNLEISSYKYPLQGAEERIKKCFTCFKDVNIRNSLKNQKGLKNTIIKLFVISNYRFFSFMCLWFFYLKFIKNRLNL